ncbi:MAG TPA: S8 family serine peptidase, partial [Patescibacteria group bacterium]|nr:S8 family serine peptidase [Patescibacteria group bacterium]
MNRFSSLKKLAIGTGLFSLTALQFATAGVLPKQQLQKPLYHLGSPDGGYYIVKQGEARADGFTTAARVITMPRLSPDKYMQGVIHIKTKQRFVVNKDAQGFQSSVLTQALAPYSVKKVGASFQEYNNGSLLSSDKAGLSRMYTVYYASPTDPYDLCRELMNNPEVEYASPVFKRSLSYTPNDPRTAQQYELSKVQAALAWDITKGKSDVLIAITDSGTDWQHEDLADNIWTNPKEIPSNGIDDDKNGKIDDVRGWDFIGNVSASEVNQGVFKEDNDPKVYNVTSNSDTRAHGTVVAGNAAAVTNNGKGIASIGHNCKILPIKIGSDNIQAGGIY